MSQFFPKPYEPFGGDMNIKVDLSNYARKADINVSRVDTSSFTLKTNLANLKSEVDKLEIDKLVPVLVDLSKLSDLAKNDVVKKDVYNRLIIKVNNIDTSRFVLKTKCNTDKSELENKIPDISNLARKTALTAVENKIPSISNLVKKTDYDTKVTEIQNKPNKQILMANYRVLTEKLLPIKQNTYLLKMN